MYLLSLADMVLFATYGLLHLSLSQCTQSVIILFKMYYARLTPTGSRFPWVSFFRLVFVLFFFHDYQLGFPFHSTFLFPTFVLLSICQSNAHLHRIGHVCEPPDALPTFCFVFRGRAKSLWRTLFARNTHQRTALISLHVPVSHCFCSIFVGCPLEPLRDHAMDTSDPSAFLPQLIPALFLYT